MRRSWTGARGPRRRRIAPGERSSPPRSGLEAFRFHGKLPEKQARRETGKRASTSSRRGPERGGGRETTSLSSLSLRGDRVVVDDDAYTFGPLIKCCQTSVECRGPETDGNTEPYYARAVRQKPSYSRLSGERIARRHRFRSYA